MATSHHSVTNTPQTQHADYTGRAIAQISPNLPLSQNTQGTANVSKGMEALKASATAGTRKGRPKCEENPISFKDHTILINSDIKTHFRF